MKVAIVYYKFLDSTGTERKIGGVETYLWNLAKLISQRGDEPIVLQPALKRFETHIGDLKIIGVERNRRKLKSNIRKDLYDAALSLIDNRKDLLIFGADHVSVRTNYPRALSIQHGISWDLPGRYLRGGLLGKMPFVPNGIRKKFNSVSCRWCFENCPNRVCVDYNFLNWYRTQITDTPRGNIWIIPNSIGIPASYQYNPQRHNEDHVKIIFARRFVEIRGTRLMIQVVKSLLGMFQDIEFAFAGEGPDELLITETFKNEPRVNIQKYFPDESLQIHGNYHIAVVPSLASEGTSLSLAEAMAAGCAVVATNVGGMTNMVIDGYNGLLVFPEVRSLTTALSKLISDKQMRLRLGQNAAITASSAFSLETWNSRWSEVLDQVRSH